jgi:hypothetical protein
VPPRRSTRALLGLLGLLCLLPALARGVPPAGAQDRTADAPADWHTYLVTPGPTRFETVQPLPPVETTDPRFGLVEAFRIAEGGLGRALGARHERIAFWWSGLQAEPGGPFNPFYFSASLLERERRQDFQVLGLLLNTPGWAAANPADGARAVPRNLGLAWDDRQNYWGRFAEQMARDYAGQIDDWIAWNEPDIQPGDPNAAYYAWAGSVEDYYQLLRVAYRAIKAGNPRARVHLAGLTYWADRETNRPQFFERLLDLMAADPTAPANDYYFDVATLHLYTDPRGLYDVPRLYRTLMQARGLDKPIWINETNVIPWDDPTNRDTGYDVPAGKRCTLADQASYLLQAFSLGLAGGAERISVYKAADGEGAAFNGDVDAIERSALVREDGSLRPAFVAYQTAVRYFQDARAAQYFRGTTAEAVAIDRPGGQRVTALWDAAPRPVVARLAASGTHAELVDAAGQVRPLAAAPDGAYAIALPAATCNTDLADPSRYLTGGETYLVVEYDVPADRAPQAPSAEPLP